MAVGYGDSKIEPIPQKDCKNMEFYIDMQGIGNIILRISDSSFKTENKTREEYMNK